MLQFQEVGRLDGKSNMGVGIHLSVTRQVESASHFLVIEAGREFSVAIQLPAEGTKSRQLGPILQETFIGKEASWEKPQNNLIPTGFHALLDNHSIIWNPAFHARSRPNLVPV